MSDLRVYGNPRIMGGNACISKTELPPNTLAPTTRAETGRVHAHGPKLRNWIRRRQHREVEGINWRRRLASPLCVRCTTLEPSPPLGRLYIIGKWAHIEPASSNGGERTGTATA